MAEPTLFDNRMVDYVKAIFFRWPDKEFSSAEMLVNMPHFYHDQDMVSAAINILLMKEEILQMPLTRETDTFKANPAAIILEKEEKERKVRKEIVDLENAERVNKTYHWTQIAAWISFFAALFLGYLELAEAVEWWPYYK